MYDKEFFRDAYATTLRGMTVNGGNPDFITSGDQSGDQKEMLIYFLSENAQPMRFAAEELIVAEGEPQAMMYFVISGIARAYSVTWSGQEITNRFMYRRGEAFIAALPEDESFDRIQAITDCELAAVPMETIKPIIRAYPDFMRALFEILLQSYKRMIKLTNMRGMTAVDRCRWLHKEHPEWETMMQKRYLSSYLGMDKAVYSRSMRRVYEEEAVQASEEAAEASAGS